uniref:Uncharacterized protein n=1 Tax=Oryza sativa subsp. japonica TaxID=39947 RepID=Q69MW3_ORYSJ|nr:hypothetical protein [Oryza sativa Japonica Group]
MRALSTSLGRNLGLGPGSFPVRASTWAEFEKSGGAGACPLAGVCTPPRVSVLLSSGLAPAPLPVIFRAAPSPPPDPVGGETAAQIRHPGSSGNAREAMAARPPLRRIQREGSRRWTGVPSTAVAVRRHSLLPR